MNYTDLKDVELLSQLKQDNHSAFKEIYKRYWRACYHQVLRKGNNKELAEEITQNVFISLWERRHEHEINHLPTYLYAAVRFSFINHIKRVLRFEHYLYLNQKQQPLFHDSLEQELAFKDLSLAFEKGVHLLPAKTKEVFCLSRMEYQSIKDIARKLKISEKAVEYHITQSLKTLRIALKEYLILILIPFLLNLLLGLS